MRKCVFAAVVCLSAAVWSSPIDDSLSRGAAFLVARQTAEGYWSDPQMPALTALPLWALGMVECPKDVLEKAAKFILSTQKPDGGFYVPKPGRGYDGIWFTSSYRCYFRSTRSYDMCVHG